MAPTGVVPERDRRVQAFAEARVAGYPPEDRAGANAPRLQRHPQRPGADGLYPIDDTDRRVGAVRSQPQHVDLRPGGVQRGKSLGRRRRFGDTRNAPVGELGRGDPAEANADEKRASISVSHLFACTTTGIDPLAWSVPSIPNGKRRWAVASSAGCCAWRSRSAGSGAIWPMVPIIRRRRYIGG